MDILEFEYKLHDIMDILDILLKEGNEKQKKQLSRLAVEILMSTLSEEE